MIHMNLSSLRRQYNLTQEELAEKIDVTRQAIAKWERGDSVPDLQHCIELADLFQVSIDDLIRYSAKESGAVIPPRGKYFFGSVTVGERGQIVIPKKAREVFRIQPGDQLLVFGDEERGIGIVPSRDIQGLMSLLLKEGLGNMERKEQEEAAAVIEAKKEEENRDA